MDILKAIESCIVSIATFYNLTFNALMFDAFSIPLKNLNSNFDLFFYCENAICGIGLKIHADCTLHMKDKQIIQ